MLLLSQAYGEGGIHHIIAWELTCSLKWEGPEGGAI